MLSFPSSIPCLHNSKSSPQGHLFNNMFPISNFVPQFSFVWSCCTSRSYFYPIHTLISVTVSSYAPESQSLYRSSRRSGIAEGADLRILPLGDSITWGQGSSNGNGYRLQLLNKLSPANTVEYIGSMRSGSMENNANEGHMGFQISAVGLMGQRSYPELPNIILLLAGTNDMIFNTDLEGAPYIMNNVIYDIVNACPDTAVLVASIPPLLNPTLEKRRIAYNARLPEVVANYANAGKQVALVDMSMVMPSHVSVLDQIHPTDDGYVTMADAWYEAILIADAKGWIKAPVQLPFEQDSSTGQMEQELAATHFKRRGSEDLETNPGRRIAGGLLVIASILAARKIANQFLLKCKRFREAYL